MLQIVSHRCHCWTANPMKRQDCPKPFLFSLTVQARPCPGHGTRAVMLRQQLSSSSDAAAASSHNTGVWRCWASAAGARDCDPLMAIWDKGKLSRHAVRTWNQQEPEALAWNYRNKTVPFGKLDGPVLSGPTAVRGAAELRWGAPPSVKWHLDRERHKPHQLWRLWWRLVDLIKKDEKNRKLGQKVWQVEIRLIVLIIDYNRPWPMLV
jgi:hypothetical protein